MTTINSNCSTVLDLPPSCIAFCPSQPHIYVVGTYFLHRQQVRNDDASNAPAHVDPQQATTTADHSVDISADEQIGNGPQKRTGSLMLFQFEHDDKITQLKEYHTDYAVLDIQWAPSASESGHLLVVAASTGKLVLYRLSGQPSELHMVATHQIVDPTTLVLSLLWHPTDSRIIGVTLSDGKVMLCRNTTSDNEDTWAEQPQAGRTAVVQTVLVHQHELEAWCMAFLPSSGSQIDVLSGGDDMLLQHSRCDDVTTVFETSSNETAGAAVAMLWKDRRIHGAGITAILPLGDDLIITGSYDDHIRLLSAPAIGRRQVLASANLDGGVWRLKVLSDDQSPTQINTHEAAGTDGASRPRNILLLASCMHAGARVVRLTHDISRNDEAWQFQVEARFEEHRSMNYGSDIWPQQALTTSRVPPDAAGKGHREWSIISTSFYDRLMCLWKCPG